MLDDILKLYVMAMAGDVRSPVPHLFGPPGCGKSTAVEQAAELIGCNLHTINVSRLSPLEVEGVQMPVTHESEGLRLSMLTATYWTQLKDGDIILLDEFLRGFPEVYNGLLDILTSRRVGSFELPKVFIIAASNSTVAYDKALEDRLLHLPVADPRKSKRARKEQAEHLVKALGLLPRMVNSMEMNSVLDTEVLPMYDILDQIKGKGSAGTALKGTSVRNLIGQGKLRQIQSTSLKELISMNNLHAMQEGKAQYVLLPSGKTKDVPSNYPDAAEKLRGNPRLTEIQALNLDLNLQLIEMESIRSTKEGSDEDDEVFDDGIPF